MRSVGEMSIFGDLAPELLGALSVIASDMHRTFDAIPGATAGDSKASCVFSATTVRDVLRRVGLLDARCVPVSVYMIAERNKQRIFTGGVGIKHDKPLADRKWNGHLVTLCQDYLIDCTLYAHKPPAWLGPRGMMALRLRPSGFGKVAGLPVRALLTSEASQHGLRFEMAWAETTNHGWMSQRDAKMTPERRTVVDKLSSTISGAVALPRRDDPAPVVGVAKG